MAQDIRVDKVLTTIARGYHNASFIGDKLFPIVNVDNETGKIPLFGKDAFIVWDTERAIRAHSNTIEGAEVSTVNYATKEHDAKRILDYREIRESELDQYQWAVNQCSDAILLKHEAICANLAFNTATYPEANTETLTDNFLNEADIDPIEYLWETCHAPLRTAIGQYPNIHVWGAKVWEKLKNHPKVVAYLSGNERKLVTLELLAQILEVDAIHIGKTMKSADRTTFTDVWGNGIVAAYIKPPSGYNRTPLEPCFGYTLRVKGHPWSDKGEEEGGKINWARTTDNFDVKVVGAESAFFLKNPIDPAVL